MSYNAPFVIATLFVLAAPTYVQKKPERDSRDSRGRRNTSEAAWFEEGPRSGG